MRHPRSFAGSVCLLLMVMAACSQTRDASLTGPESARSSSQPILATATDRPVFVMNGNSLPDGFDAQVASSGGSVLYSFDDLGLVVTTGLSDANAAGLARGTAC